MRRIKIFQIGLVWFPEQGGGLDRFYYDLIRRLPENGFDVRGLVVGSEQVDIQTEGAIKSATDTSTPLLKKLISIYYFSRATFRSFAPDLLVSHFALHAFPILSLIGRRPLVVHFHGPWALEASAEGSKIYWVKIAKFIEKAVYSRAKRIIVLSKAFRKILHEEYNIPLDKIVIIPGAIETRKFTKNAISISRDQARNELGWSLERPTILIVRRLANRMGLEDAIIAIENVRVRFPNVLLLIAGKGHLHSELSQIIIDRALENNVKLLGFIPDDKLALNYRAADFTLVPTISLEGFGLITVESLASGTPVLVTPVGGLPEVVEDLSADLVLPATGPNAIADGLMKILSGEQALPDEETCMEYADKNFSWVVASSRIAEIYREALE